ncbi:Nif3-like dinuclear metal center hexameric protein [Clostridium manihotivorum]|uniref:GTP cyclohydrolase 1 type 2 homolog n=1 Tax=Clostridium manihotivorum TaxID=2320868 RepID=A0A410DRT5_9CLOT|nr:Nif3-like dinuclear metal center hexameric protein [Clostridium manihotivorum]QAA31745.1 Nif3-like dinuclear metal center hexameric protein [Clostridium manihotivorum]
MKVFEISKIIEQMAPKVLKEDYDNVGLMVGDNNAEVSTILVALDCTLSVIEEAKAIGAEMILTHHPLLFRKPKTITNDTLQGRKIIELIKNNINLYSSHTNLDSTKAGMNDTIVELLGFESEKILEPTKVPNFEGSGIGRLIKLESAIKLSDLVQDIKSKLGINNLRFTGDLNKEVKKIAIINGSGQDFFEISNRYGADCIITGDTTYHYVSDYNEMGISILDIGHFGSEWPLFINICNRLKEKFIAVDKNIKVVISKSTNDPYNFI